MPTIVEEETHYRLTDMEYDEVSLCAIGVNQPARVVLFKSAISKDLPKKNMSPENCDVDHKKLHGKLPCPKCGTKKKISKSVAGSYEYRTDRIREALNAAYGGERVYIWPRATFNDSVVFQKSAGDGPSVNYVVDYTFVDGGISFGEAQLVEMAEIVVLPTPVIKAITDNEDAIAKSRKRDRLGQFSDSHGPATAQEKRLLKETVDKLIADNEAAISKANPHHSKADGKFSSGKGGGGGAGGAPKEDKSNGVKAGHVYTRPDTSPSSGPGWAHQYRVKEVTGSQATVQHVHGKMVGDKIKPLRTNTVTMDTSKLATMSRHTPSERLR